MSKYIATIAVAVLATILCVTAVVADEKESPFVVQGKVTDDAGKPLEGVEITASCGWGSLFQTGAAKTDSMGQYRLVFGPGIYLAKRKMGVGWQVAIISPHMKGWNDILLGHKGKLMMTESKEGLKAEHLKAYSGVVAANEPYTLNFTMAKAAAIRGRFVNEFGRPVKGVEICLTGDILPPGCSVLDSVETDEEGRFAFDSVPAWLADPSISLKWRFTIRPFGVRHEMESSAFEVSAGEVSVQNLTLESAGDKHETRLSLNRRSGER